MLQYSHHDDPQLRGQAALLACSILSSVARGYDLVSVKIQLLIEIVDTTLKDRETAACRLAINGLHSFLPTAVECRLCVEIVPLLQSLLTLSENPYWLVKVDLLECFASFSWIALWFGLKQQDKFDVTKFQVAFLSESSLNCLFSFNPHNPIFFICRKSDFCDDRRRRPSSSECNRLLSY